MLARLTRIPRLIDENITVRRAVDKTEREAANKLVFSNYVDQGYWNSDEISSKKKFLRSPYRITFVAIRENRIVGTISIIKDSPQGLPADDFQPVTMKKLREKNETIVEVSALAMDKSYKHQRNLIFFLFKYLYQYSFYYEGIDRFVVVCTPQHAAFYEAVCGLQCVGHESHYTYVRVKAKLLTVHLAELHKHFCNVYEAETTAYTKNNFYRFLLVDEHPNLIFPAKTLANRPRDLDWARQGVG